MSENIGLYDGLPSPERVDSAQEFITFIKDLDVPNRQRDRDRDNTIIRKIYELAREGDILSYKTFRKAAEVAKKRIHKSIEAKRPWLDLLEFYINQGILRPSDMQEMQLGFKEKLLILGHRFLRPSTPAIEYRKHVRFPGDELFFTDDRFVYYRLPERFYDSGDVDSLAESAPSEIKDVVTAGRLRTVVLPNVIAQAFKLPTQIYAVHIQTGENVNNYGSEYVPISDINYFQNERGDTMLRFYLNEYGFDNKKTDIRMAGKSQLQVVHMVKRSGSEGISVSVQDFLANAETFDSHQAVRRENQEISNSKYPGIITLTLNRDVK